MGEEITFNSEADAAAGGVGGKLTKKEKKELTKRQRRKQPNEQNLWPQHPKIQDMSKRHRAYIREAGLGNTKKQVDVDPSIDLLSPEVKFCRLLAGTDQRKRHLAVNKLKAYLKARCDINNENGGLSELDLMKLWKALWHTLYMADKVPVQDELSKCLADMLWCVSGTEEEDEYAGQAYMDMYGDEDPNVVDADDYDDDEDITMEEVVNTLGDPESGSEEEEEEEEDSSDADDSSGSDSPEGLGQDQEIQVHANDGDEEIEELDDSEIPHCRGAHLASLFIRTFFRTLKREWGKMDKYRIDKFYTLVRLLVHEVFRYMSLRHWNLGICRLFNDCLFEEVLNQLPNGLRYHLIDISLEELAKVNAKAPMPLTEATFLDALEPYFAMAQTGAGSAIVQSRVMENVLEKFLNKFSVVSETAVAESEQENDDSDKKESLIMDQVHVGSIAQFIFDLASDPETSGKYRKSLYEMHKSYMRRLKKVGKDVELPGSEVDDDEDEEDIDGFAVDADEVDQQEVVPFEQVKEGFVTPKTKTSNKKRKRKRNAAEQEDEDEAPELVETSSQKKKKKKNKGKQKGQFTETQHDGEEEDQVVTISLGEQKRAKAEARKSKKKEHKQEAKNATPATAGIKGKKSSGDSSAKRVKFTANQSISYKASMKGLRTATPPKTSERTPEKGILLNKGRSKSASVNSKAGRKRAVNYF
jgi:hypothetical protein